MDSFLRIHASARGVKRKKNQYTRQKHLFPKSCGLQKQKRVTIDGFNLSEIVYVHQLTMDFDVCVLYAASVAHSCIADQDVHMGV